VRSDIVKAAARVHRIKKREKGRGALRRVYKYKFLHRPINQPNSRKAERRGREEGKGDGIPD